MEKSKEKILVSSCLLGLNCRFDGENNYSKEIDEFLKDYEHLATWILLPIEITFLIFVLIEFKMTRKSFEWQKEEREKSKDEEANRQLLEIIKFFLYYYYNNKFDYECSFRELQDIRKEMLCTKDERKKLNKKLIKLDLQRDKTEIIKNLISIFEKERNNEKQISKTARDMLEKIIDVLIINSGEINIIAYNMANIDRINNFSYDDGMKKLHNIINKYTIPPELAKAMDLDYKLLKQIYNLCLYGKFFN